MSMLRLSLGVFGGVLFLLVATLALARHKPSAAYWIVEWQEDWQYGHNLYIMSPDGQWSRPALSGDEYFVSWPPGGQWIYYHTQGRLERKLVNGRRREVVAQWQNNSAGREAGFVGSPDWQWVAFASPRNGPNTLYSVRTDGRDLRALVHHPDESLYKILWSRDGQWIYFQGCSSQTETCKLYRIRPDGRDEQYLTDTIYEYTHKWRWSADGQSVVFASYNTGQLYRVRVDGDRFQLVAGEVYTNAAHWYTDEGEWVIYISQVPLPGGKLHYDLFRIHPDGTEPRQLTATPTREVVYGLSPDEAWILYGDVTAEGTQGLFRVRLDGSERQFLFAPLLQYIGWVGDWLYVEGGQRAVDYGAGEDVGVYRLRADGSETQRLAALPDYSVGYHKLTPDGQWIIYTYLVDHFRYRLGVARLRIRTDGGEVEPLPVNIGVGSEDLFFSPIINLPWDSGVLLAAGLGLIAAGVVARPLWSLRSIGAGAVGNRRVLQ